MYKSNGGIFLSGVGSWGRFRYLETNGRRESNAVSDRQFPRCEFYIQTDLFIFGRSGWADSIVGWEGSEFQTGKKGCRVRISGSECVSLDRWIRK